MANSACLIFPLWITVHNLYDGIFDPVLQRLLYASSQPSVAIAFAFNKNMCVVKLPSPLYCSLAIDVFLFFFKRAQNFDLSTALPPLPCIPHAGLIFR